jgi:pimeloyl-ACP methyl ester carboxylesterase
MLTKRFVALTALVIVLIGASGCATPVGVKRTSEQAVYRQLTTSVLTGGKPSAYSMQFLERLSLFDEYKRDPKRALAKLHRGLGGLDEHDRLFALSELSYAYARKRHDQSYFLAAAVYAYAFLFSDDTGKTPIPFDPRLRLAMDLYNSSINQGLHSSKGNEVDLSAGRFILPFGSLDLSAEPSGFFHGGYKLVHFVSVADLEVRGFRNRYRKPGIGAPLSAQVERTKGHAADKWIAPRSKVPVTAFVRFDRPRSALSAGEVTGRIELYNVDEVPAVNLVGHSVPLEFDPSTALAYRLEGAPVWDFEIAGFRRGDFSLFGKKPQGDLIFLNPYYPGKIPVVFVHGTASSPARWAEMVNEFLGDSRIAGRYQFWFFIYNSGNPISLSAMHLRENLELAFKELDPEGSDAALRQMVVIGHSQGGLLTKMTVVNSGTRFWENISREPFEQAALSAETKDLLGRSLFVEPLPFVKRVVFIATPHRGSFMSENIIGKIGRRLIRLPATVTKVGVEIVKLNPVGAARTAIRVPTSIENMDWSNPFLRTLASLEIAEGVQANSIIPVKGDGPPEKGDDGVVRYASAHIEPVESELVVRSAHSTQSNPHTIEEVRRILYRHAGME